MYKLLGSSSKEGPWILLLECEEDFDIEVKQSFDDSKYYKIQFPDGHWELWIRSDYDESMYDVVRIKE